MDDLEGDLADARDLEVDAIAASIADTGFSCTRCGECCTADGDQPHTATVFPDEIRTLEDATGRDWSDVARPMPYGLDEDGLGTTFEWALQTDENGDCVFYEETDGLGRCTVHADRPLICRTYPFSLDLGRDDPPDAVVDRIGALLVHDCAGLGADIGEGTAESLAETLKQRAIVELREAIAVRDRYAPHPEEPTVVYDSEGPKRPDGTPLEGR